MSQINSLLQRLHDKCHHFSVDHYRPVMVIAICTVSTVTLACSKEEQYIIGASYQVKANASYSDSIALTNESLNESTIANQRNIMQMKDSSGVLSGYALQQISIAEKQDEMISNAVIRQQEAKCSQARQAAEQQRRLDEKKAEEKTMASLTETATKTTTKTSTKKTSTKSSAKKITLSKAERKVLERIVQAEAGNQDIKGRMLVANVVLNRVKSKSFPNTVKGVVFQHKGSCYQFSPAKSGSVNRVKVTSTTKKAVSRVLNGEDYSKGAMYFVARRAANKNSLSWFDRKLTRLFTHGGHTFYK